MAELYCKALEEIVENNPTIKPSEAENALHGLYSLDDPAFPSSKQIRNKVSSIKAAKKRKAKLIS